jgi:predicted transcriptional regulator
MTALDPGNGKVLRTDAAGCQVGDVMVRNPKTVSVETNVSQLRGLFENDRVRAALLVDGDRFAGVIAPEDLPATAMASEPARAYARRNVPAVGPDTDLADALAVMDTRGDRRLVVLGPDGTTLVGLLCLDKSGSSFCVGDHR